MIMPSHAKQVQRYDEQMPLFARFQVESYLGGMFNPVVQLKSGGYIVIGITEALVAIDVNSGRATKEGSIEDTALKTNLEASEEIARQLRLRDLAGLIVIDFIDMEERRNNAAVEKRLKDKLKTDRARIQVGRISGFGLMEMSRQRLRPGMLESTTQPCSHCHGTGLIRSDDNLGLQVLRALEEEGTRKRSKEVLLKAPIGIVNFLINGKREHIALIEARYGMSVRIECDPALISPDYVIEKFKTATRVVPEPSAVISGNASMMGAPVAEEDDEDIVDEMDEVEEAEGIETVEPAEAAPAAAEGQNGGPGKKRRRRRRRKKPGMGGQPGEAGASDEGEADEGEDEDDQAEAADQAAAEVTAAEAPAEAAAEPVAAEPEAAEPVATEPAAKKRTRAPRGKAKAAAPEAEAAAPAEAAAAEIPAEAVAQATAAKPKASRSRAKPKAKAEPAAEAVAAEPAAAPALLPDPGLSEALPVEGLRPDPEDRVSEAQAPAEAVAAEAAAEEAAGDEAAGDEAAAKPRKKGWWSLGR